MKRKILIVISAILLVIILRILYNISINSIIINKYNNGKYESGLAKLATYSNLTEPYISYYNYGNILYQIGEYEEAIEQYKIALNRFAPENKECKIRINYALAICKMINVDEKDENSIQNAIKNYETAVQILTEKGCANKNDNNGHNKEAQTLKTDIQNEIDRLKKLLNYSDTSDSGGDDDSDEDTNEKDAETIEKKINNIKQNSIQEQRKVENFYKNSNSLEFNILNKNW